MTGYHVTPASCLDRIRSEGLRPCDTAKDGWYAEMADCVVANAGVEAVYVWTDEAQAAMWAQIEASHYGEPPVVVVVDLAGLPTENDPELAHYAGWDSATRVRAAVDADRIVRWFDPLCASREARLREQARRAREREEQR